MRPRLRRRQRRQQRLLQQQRLLLPRRQVYSFTAAASHAAASAVRPAFNGVVLLRGLASDIAESSPITRSDNFWAEELSTLSAGKLRRRMKSSEAHVLRLQ